MNEFKRKLCDWFLIVTIPSVQYQRIILSIAPLIRILKLEVTEMTFGEKIKVERSKQHVTQTEVAEQLYVSRKTVCTV